MNQLIASFNAGELSPRLQSRVDLEKYASGCRVLQNFLIMPYGGVNRRPGTGYVGKIKQMDKKARLISFNFSTTTNFILEFGNLYVRFYSNGQQVLDESDEILEVETPYTEAQIFEIQYTQINDVMFIVHPNHPPMALSRVADNNWTIAEIAWDWPTVLSENLTDTTIAPSSVTGDITLTASADIFTESMVGGYFQFIQRKQASSLVCDMTSTNATTGITVLGSWDFVTHGTWTGTIYIERSYDDGTTWDAYRKYTGYADRNISADGTEAETCLLRVRYEYTSHSGTPVPKAYLEAYDSETYAAVKITGYASATMASAKVVQDFDSTDATTRWFEGAWSAKNGYPRTVCLHEQRLVFGGNSKKPQTIWASAIGDFYNFKLTSKDDAAFAFTLASSETNAINWMVSQRALCIGTAADEYVLTPGSTATGSGTAITPSNFQLSRQSHYGSIYASAIVANDVSLFIQRQGRKIREFVYSFQKDGYVAADLTLLADHLTSGGVKQTAFQQQPDAILWCVTGDGILSAMTYERDQNVVGWHRHVTDGEFESVASIYSEDAADELWCIVKRVVNGETVRYIERFDPDFRDALEGENKAAWWYLDCASRVTLDTEMTEFSGFDHLEGATVDVFADGAVAPACVVADGKITLQSPAKDVLAGLPYLSQLTPMPLDPGQMGDGTAQTRKFRVNRIVLRIYKSLGGEVLVDGDNWDPVYSRDTSDAMDDSPPTFTGDRQINIARGFEIKGTVSVRQTQPLPLTLLAIVPKYDVSGD